jgi:hypothetical protein
MTNSPMCAGAARRRPPRASCSRAVLAVVAACAAPARTDPVSVQEDPRWTFALREIEDIRSFLGGYLGPDDIKTTQQNGHGWKHKVNIVKEKNGQKRIETVERFELLDAFVVDDPALYAAVTSDANRGVGVAQGYTWLKSLVDRLFARAAIGKEGDIELKGKVKHADGKGGATYQKVDGLFFVDALLNQAGKLEVEGRSLVQKPAPASVPPQGTVAKRYPTMPVYLSRQRCEVCATVLMRKVAGGPHLCAGMEYYFDTCNDVLVSLLHWYPSVMFWMQTGGCLHTDVESGTKMMKPCAPHAVCSWMISPNYHIPFCPWDGSWRAPGLENSLKG